MKTKHLILGAAISSICAAQTVSADSLYEAISSGTASGDIRVRYESVEQDNARDDASALTVRTRLGYKTGEANGLSAFAEFEDVRAVAGVDDYSTPNGFNGTEYSVIADPETTELDQGFLQYKQGSFTGKLGRQVMTFDNHRFVGHVGWRQDRQTFDGVALNLKPSDELSLSYNYIDERERILAEDADIDSKDHLFNASYKTSAGTVTGYAYLLEIDNDTDNALDTYGVRFAGKSGKISYAAEFSTQSAESGGADFDASYLMGEIGYNFGPVTLKGTYEELGSDDGAYGFSTPLATLHKFNGWADQFLSTPDAGLQDLAISLSGKAGNGKWAVIYHEFAASESIDADDFGSELDLVYSQKLAKNYNFGVKAAFYSAEDIKVDTDKIWLWVGTKF